METYRPSGRFGALTLPLALGAVVVGVLAAWIYQRLLAWIPLIYLNLLITIGFGVGLGILVVLVLRLGKVRNHALGAAVAVVVAIAADVASFHWAYRIAVPELYGELEEEKARQERMATFEKVLARRRGEPEPEPLVLPSYAEFRDGFTFGDWWDLRTESGWSVGRAGRGGLELSGVFVYAVWLVEAGILAVLAVLVAHLRGRDPYCESCDRWTQSGRLEPWRDVDAKALHRAARAGEVAALLAPQRAPRSGETGAYVIHVCPSCDEGGFVDVAVSRVLQKGKEKKTETDVLVRGLVVSSAERDALVEYQFPRRSETPDEEPPPPVRRRRG